MILPSNLPLLLLLAGLFDARFLCDGCGQPHVHRIVGCLQDRTDALIDAIAIPVVFVDNGIGHGVR